MYSSAVITPAVTTAKARPGPVRWLVLGLGLLIFASGLVPFGRGLIELGLLPAAGPPSIRDVELARAGPDVATEPTTTFNASDSTIHCLIRLSSPSRGDHVRIVWTALEAGNGRYVNEVISEDELVVTDPRAAVHFGLTNRQAWPIGRFEVDIYLNGSLAKSVPFTVE